jgi:hypothetical protein
VTDLTVNQQAALEDRHIRFVFFAEFFFTSGTARVSTLNIPCSWGGHNWMGLGTLGDISAIDQEQGTASQELTFKLSLPNTDWLALAVGPVEEYRGNDARLYFCPLNENFQLIDTPVRCWSGTMNQMPSSITGKRSNPVGTIELKCETSAYGLKRPSALRLNAAQQKLKYPNDTSMDRLVNMVGKQTPWLTIRYQRR